MTMTQRTIVQEAAGLFRRQGFDATTMSDIAAAVGLSKAGVYHHYQSKEELLEDVVDAGAEALVRQLRSVEVLDLEPAEKMREFLRTRMQTIADHQDTLTVIWQERPAIAQATFERLADRLREYRAGVTRLIEDARTAGEIRADIDIHLLMLAVDGMTGWSYLWMQPGQGTSPQEIGEKFWEYLWEGLQPGTGG